MLVAGVTVKEEVMEVLSEELSYLVSDLDPFTEYTFKVSASTTVGEGPATYITEKTREQGGWLHAITISCNKLIKKYFCIFSSSFKTSYYVCLSVPSSVLEVSYKNISSTSVLVTWAPPLNPNGRITYYTVYGLNLHNNQALKRVTNTTSIFITGWVLCLTQMYWHTFYAVIITTRIIIILCSVFYCVDLDKYTGYKLRVAASTAVGESSLSEEDDIFVFTLEDGMCGTNIQ